MKRAIIVGASSGIGWELAIQLDRADYQLGLMARREDHLLQLRQQLTGAHIVQTVDVTHCEQAQVQLQALIERMQEVDMVILNAGVGLREKALEWDSQCAMIDVNVRGFCAMAVVSMQYFEARGEGHLVGISSLAAHVSGSMMPTYHATKAYVSSYLEGLRARVGRKRLSITITTVEPGFVATPMVEGNPPWMASVERAVAQMMTAIMRRKNHVYVTRRWRIVAWLAYVTPNSVLRKFL